MTPVQLRKEVQTEITKRLLITPLKVAPFTEAKLPPAADWPDCTVYVSDRDVLATSNGTAWLRSDTGASSADPTAFAKSIATTIADAIAASYRNGSTTYDPASLNDGDGVTTTVTVTGAVMGEFAVASFSLDLQGVQLAAWVSAADTVSVRFQNETTAPVDLASGTLRARVIKL